MGSGNPDCMGGVGRAAAVGVQYRSKHLDALNHSGPRPHDEGIGIDGPHLRTWRQHAASYDILSQTLRILQTKAARGDDHHIGCAASDGFPRSTLRVGARSPHHRSPTSCTDQIGHPMSIGERRIRPFEQQRRATSDSLESCCNRSEPTSALGNDLGGAFLCVRSRTDNGNRVDDLVERHRVECHHFGAATEVGHRIIDFADIDGAHCTEILGDHHRRRNVAEGAAIEVVQVCTCGHPLLDHDVDLGR